MSSSANWDRDRATLASLYGSNKAAPIAHSAPLSSREVLCKYPQPVTVTSPPTGLGAGGKGRAAPLPRCGLPTCEDSFSTRKTTRALFQKIKAVYDTNPAKFRTLQNILEVEKEMYGAEWPKVGATLALMWLKRGLRFIQVFLQSICDGERDENHPNLIRVNATKAYEMALKKYHGWIVQKIFQAALYAAPYKSDFLKALSKGQNVTEEECLEKVRLFLVNYTATIDVIYEMYTKMNAELNYKV
uniref:Glycolipid transfer protein n=1 Tax=Canis lupus familiaris TaxID=9615 RepID=A0A8P0TT47_CANLF